ncbi:MAG TPA: mannose-6-phosphate isomerase, class I [Polyangia bacterium]|nr:mannose-6-phosphate isomerase, class I [Polyangia bacterium]
MPDETDALTAWTRDPAPLRLACGVQHYDWGERGPQALIAQLLGVNAGPEQPFAELWIGAHPALPATVTLGAARMTLPALIARAPERTLGTGSIQRFGGELPFLAKVLTAERPLSIQAHPNRAQAEAGFAREEAAGVPRAAPQRNYRDRNHKPELILALGDFFALKGFRPSDEIAAALRAVPELRPLLADPPPAAAPAGGAMAGATQAEARDWLRRLFERCMSPAEVETDRALGALLDRLLREPSDVPARPERREYWLARTARLLPASAKPDRGLLAFYLLNLVHLRAGQALFLNAGEPHAYLEGRGLEVMASSDNVLRGGLTSKHVDLPELLRVLTFSAQPARPLRADAEGRYPAGAAEFEAQLLPLAPGQPSRPLRAGAASVLLVLEGAALLQADARREELTRGEAWFVPAAVKELGLETTGAAAARVFVVTVPATK